MLLQTSMAEKMVLINFGLNRLYLLVFNGGIGGNDGNKVTGGSISSVEDNGGDDKVVIGYGGCVNHFSGKG